MVHLKIFDVSGKEVRMLINNELNAGTYETAWDASGFASGIYYSRLNMGNYSVINKMILLK